MAAPISHGTDSILKFRDLLLSPCREGFHRSGLKAGGRQDIPRAFLNAFPYLLPTLSILFLESSEGRIKNLSRIKNRAFRAKHAVCTKSLTATAKSLQSCPTLCNPIDGSPPGFPVPGILQARTLEWVAISFSNAWKWKLKVKSLSRIWLLATPWTAAYQDPPSMGFSRQEYWSWGAIAFSI